MATVPLSTRFIGISENVNLEERKSAVLNAETQPYTIADLVSTIGTGAQGPQGVQGPPGPLGPVGPAGLTWRGAWVSGTSYVANDAVGYNGASWFCILATSGTTTPNLATANWALLASQGAQGIQGVQGPTGPQGAGATQTLQQTVDLGNVISDDFEISQTISANRNRFDNSFDGTFGIYGLGFFNKSDGTNAQNIELPETLTGGIKYITFPNATGTVALTSDITLPYKEYVSTVQFNSSGDPLVTEAYSNIQGGVTITSTGTGVYQIASSNRFTSNKTIINPFAYQGSTTDSGAVRLPIYSSNAIVGYYWLQRINSNEVRMSFVDTSSNPINPNTLLGTRKITIEIKVYN